MIGLACKRLFFWLSGAGSRTLEECPNWEQRKYVAFGATVLVPCLFAFVAAAYAISTLTENTWVIYPVALLWSFIILTIDRALLASYRPYLSFGRKFGQFGLRFLVAVLLGVTISHPLVLLLFRDTIHAEIERDRQVEVAAAREDAVRSQARMEQRIAQVETGLSEQREKLARTYEASFLVAPVDDATERAAAQFVAGEQALQALDRRVERARQPLQQQLDALEKSIAEVTPQLTTMQGELAFWQTEFEREINGQRSGIVGVGPRARSIESDQINWRRAEVTRLSGELEALLAERQRLQRESEAIEAGLRHEFVQLQESEKARMEQELQAQQELRRQVEQETAAQFVAQQDVVRAGINEQIALRVTELERLQADLAIQASEAQQRIEQLRTEPRRDLLTQTLALHHLFSRGEDGGRFALIAYVLLIALFVLVDTIPLVVKFFSRPGPYDTLVDQDEVRFEKNHEAFLLNYGRYIEQATASGLASLTRHQPLENALVMGIERSRAAKAFMESLMELEREFQERMRRERELLAREKDETSIRHRLALLEDMAAGFQQDLRERMTEFFSPAEPRARLDANV